VYQKLAGFQLQKHGVAILNIDFLDFLNCPHPPPYHFVARFPHFQNPKMGEGAVSLRKKVIFYLLGQLSSPKFQNREFGGCWELLRGCFLESEVAGGDKSKGLRKSSPDGLP
jgi:hypothetical protein